MSDIHGRILTVYTRYYMSRMMQHLLVADTSPGGVRVARELHQLVASRAMPKMIVSDSRSVYAGNGILDRACIDRSTMVETKHCKQFGSPVRRLLDRSHRSGAQFG